MIETIKTFIFNVLIIFFIIKNVSSHSQQPAGDWKTDWKYELLCTKHNPKCTPIRYILAYAEIKFTDTIIQKQKQEEPKQTLNISGKKLTQPIATIRFIADLAKFNGANDNEALLIDIAADNILDLRRGISGNYEKKVARNLTELEISMGEDEYLVNNKLSWVDILFASTIAYFNYKKKNDIIKNHSKLTNLYDKVLGEEAIENWLQNLPNTSQTFSNEDETNLVEGSILPSLLYGLNLDDNLIFPIPTDGLNLDDNLIFPIPTDGLNLDDNLIFPIPTDGLNLDDNLIFPIPTEMKPKKLTEDMFSFCKGTRAFHSDMLPSNWKDAEYQLLYSNDKGSAEGIKWYLHYLNIKYTDIPINDDQFDELRKFIPFGPSPLLQINGKIVLNRSIAIARYFAKKAKLAGSNEWETMLINTTIDYILDLIIELQYENQSNQDSQSSFVLLENRKVFWKYMQLFEMVLTRNDGYFVNGKLSMADIYFVQILRHLSKYVEINDNDTRVSHIIALRKKVGVIGKEISNRLETTKNST